jgi:hypothetical protein
MVSNINELNVTSQDMVHLNERYSVIIKSSNFIFSERTINKVTGELCFSIVAVYQDLLSLINDFMHHSIAQDIYLIRVSDVEGMKSGVSQLFELCQRALSHLIITEAKV